MMKAFFLFCLAGLAIVGANPVGYDPMAVGKGKIESATFEVNDQGRGRILPIRVYFPERKDAAPVVLFSHGLGGSRDNNPYLGNHWAGRGYVVVFVQHPGSDESVWKDVAPLRRMAALKKAASGKSFMDRTKDIPAVIDALEEWNKEDSHVLKGRMDLKKIGMSGHSFGAVTSQAMAGQIYGRKKTFREERISAAVMMSPSIPRIGDPAKAFGQITIPCLLMTGTEDDSPIGDATPEDRRKVFPNLTKAPAWQVVFDGATHMDFGERKPRGRLTKGKGNYHVRILALTTAFWDAHLRADGDAKEWLNGKGVEKSLDGKDKWEINAKARG